MLTAEQQIRYSRNILLPELGVEGQRRLLQSKVLIIGLGGLGSPVAMYLAAAGVGTLGLVDNDCVDLSNLQRQILYRTADVGKSKVDMATKNIHCLNADVKIVGHNVLFDAEGGASLVAEYDFVVDATDSITTKFLINDLCVEAGVPFCHGGVLEFIGQVLTVIPGKTACYRCFFKKAPVGDSARRCSHGGVLGSVAGIIGSIQATEALKYLSHSGELLTNSLLICDVATAMFRRIPVTARQDCSACSQLF